MKNEDKVDFSRALANVMAGYAKPLPDNSMVNVWFNLLASFELGTIRRAFEAYIAERPDFAPGPNGIAARCKLLDGRPEENEAWSRAMLSLDERMTVVWTAEMAEAYRVAEPLMASGDEIGARMAFKDAYARLVAEARARNLPAVWTVSSGWDGDLRQEEVRRATAAGLLEGPPARLALADESGLPPARPEGLARVLEALAGLKTLEQKAAEREAEVEAADQARRDEADRRAKNYLKAHPEARYGNLKHMGK